MFNGIEGQIDIDLRPVQVMSVGTFDLEDRADRGLLEPGEFIERKEELSFIYQNPQAMLRDWLSLANTVIPA